LRKEKFIIDDELKTTWQGSIEEKPDFNDCTGKTACADFPSRAAKSAALEVK
jgi:hypothetical protein